MLIKPLSARPSGTTICRLPSQTDWDQTSTEDGNHSSRCPPHIPMFLNPTPLLSCFTQQSLVTILANPATGGVGWKPPPPNLLLRRPCLIMGTRKPNATFWLCYTQQCHQNWDNWHYKTIPVLRIRGLGPAQLFNSWDLVAEMPEI